GEALVVERRRVSHGVLQRGGPSPRRHATGPGTLGTSVSRRADSTPSAGSCRNGDAAMSRAPRSCSAPPLHRRCHVESFRTDARSTFLLCRGTSHVATH